jgi:hypothetical protein
MIENRNLQVGTKLVARYHKQNFTCEVVEVEEGKLRYRLEDGREFKSPSAAGTAITGGACNGWAFWKIAVETKTTENPIETNTQEQSENAADAPAEEKPAEVKKTGTYKMRNQKGAPKGLARWFCYDCAEPFNAPAGEKHAVCPNNHSNKK